MTGSQSVEKFYKIDFTKLPKPGHTQRVKKRKLFVLVAAWLTCLPLTPVLADDMQPDGTLLIVELQTSGFSEGAEVKSAEFVKLYNPTAQSVYLACLKLQYRSIGSVGDWSKPSIAQTCSSDSPMVEPGGYAVLATAAVAVPGSVLMSGGFSAEGGQIRIARNDGTTSDVVVYGGPAIITDPAPAPAAGQSLKRKVAVSGSYQVTGSNANDFILGCGEAAPADVRQPLAGTSEGCPLFVLPESESLPKTQSPVEEPLPPTNSEEIPNESTPVNQPESADTDPLSDQSEDEETPVPEMVPISYLPVFINELLPDPESPAQDATDEFIELFNPNSEPVDLKDYQLQSGTNYRYKFVLPDITLGQGEYLAITSEESGLALSNSGASVRILNPNGEIIYEVDDYGKAVEGQTWAKKADGTWQWTTTPTPNTLNTFTLPPPKVSKAAAKKAVTTKKATTSKAKVASATKEATKPQDSSFEESHEPPANYWLLGGVGSMVVGYGVYEYRQGLLSAGRNLWKLVRGGQGKAQN